MPEDQVSLGSCARRLGGKRWPVGTKVSRGRPRPSPLAHRRTRGPEEPGYPRTPGVWRPRRPRGPCPCPRPPVLPPWLGRERPGVGRPVASTSGACPAEDESACVATRRRRALQVGVAAMAAEGQRHGLAAQAAMLACDARASNCCLQVRQQREASAEQFAVGCLSAQRRRVCIAVQVRAPGGATLRRLGCV